MTEKIKSDYRSLGSSELYVLSSISVLLFILFFFYSIRGNTYDFHFLGITYVMAMIISIVLALFTLTSYKIVCGKPNIYLAFSSSYIPITVIFVVGTIILQVYPGWVRGLSNTFGTFLINMAGFRKFIFENNLISTGVASDEISKTQVFNEILYKIKQDPSVLFNEITVDDYKFSQDENSVESVYWPQLVKLRHLFNQEVLFINPQSDNSDHNGTTINPEIGKTLAKFIFAKSLVGYFIWYSFLATTTFLVALNNILNSDECSSYSKDNVEFSEFVKRNIEEKNN